MNINIYWLSKTNLKIKFVLKCLSSLNYEMAYSETRTVIGGLAHVTVLIFIAIFIKGLFEIKTEETEDVVNLYFLPQEYLRNLFEYFGLLLEVI